MNQPAQVGPHPSGGRSRRRLQWVLGPLAALPVLSAFGEIVRGPQGVPGGSPDVAPTVDSSLRYANAFKLAMGLVIWSELARVERSPAMTVALSTIFVGGLARLWSWRQRGRPHPVAVAATALETLAVPVLIAWKRSVSIRSRT